MKVTLSRDDRPLGVIWLVDGDLDFEEIIDPRERERLGATFGEFRDKSLTVVWSLVKARRCSLFSTPRCRRIG